MITRNNIETVKQQVVEFFGVERANELLAGSIAVAHKAYSEAYQNFDDKGAAAYEGIVTLKMMMVKSV